MTGERAPKTAAFDKATKLTVVLLLVAWVIDYADRLLMNLALPLISSDFGLDHTQQGLLLSSFFLTYALFQVPGGLLADRFGAVRVMAVAVLAWSAFTALTGAVTTFLLLLAVRLLFGAAQGLFPSAATKALAERTSPDHRMGANGWVQTANAFAILLAPLAGAPLIAAWGWRGAFLAISVLGLGVWIALVRWLPAPRPESAVAPATDRRTRKTVLRSPTMWGFALMFFGYDVIVWGLAAWVPSYLQTERGLSVTATGVITVIPGLLGGAAVVVGGIWIDRLAGRHRVIVIPAMLAAAGALAVTALAESLWVFVTAMTITSVLAALCFMPIFAVPLRGLPPRVAGTAAGLIAFGGQVAGIVAPLTMGVLIDHYSYQVAFLFLIAGAVCTAVASSRLPQNGGQLLDRLGLVRNEA